MSEIVQPSANLVQRALDCLNQKAEDEFMLMGKLSGKSGAWALITPNGDRGILKTYDDSSCSTVKETVLLMEHLRAKGYPTPRPLCFGPIPGGGYFYLQEWLPGCPMRSPGIYRELNQHELNLLLHILSLHESIASPSSKDWIGRIEEVVLYQQGEWLAVAQSSLPVVQRLLEKCLKRCSDIRDLNWRHDDLVIGDFGPHNVLLNDQGQLSAVFDLDGAGCGDRVIDMVGLFYMVEPELLPVVRCAALQLATPSVLTACGVYWIVRRLYQGIQGKAANLTCVAEQMLAHFELLT